MLSGKEHMPIVSNMTLRDVGKKVSCRIITFLLKHMSTTSQLDPQFRKTLRVLIGKKIS